MMINMDAEIHAAACKATHRRYQGQFAAADISHATIYGPGGLSGDFGVARAKFHGNLWESDPDGQEVFVIGVYDHPQEPLTDLVAFQITNPTRWWLRLGQAVVLGLHNARLALFKEEPILIHATPLDWLRAKCQGCCVLDWNADILSRLDGYGVLAADADTGRRLEQAFNRHINIPQVRIMEAQREAA